MKLTSIILLLSVLAFSAAAHEVSMFYCGFGGNFCGQSSTDDVNPGSSFVILAFVNTNYDGSVTIDDVNFPKANVSSWQSSGKKVIISVGGQNGNWLNVFASSSSIDNFVKSLSNIISQYNLDGVDLDIENYATPPITVANAIIQLKEAIGSKLLIVSPEDIGAYEGTTVPD
jgi:Glycosyl hydrolases family 18